MYRICNCRHVCLLTGLYGCIALHRRSSLSQLQVLQPAHNTLHAIYSSPLLGGHQNWRLALVARRHMLQVCRRR
jgi:hypothetical protein